MKDSHYLSIAQHIHSLVNLQEEREEEEDRIVQNAYTDGHVGVAFVLAVWYCGRAR